MKRLPFLSALVMVTLLGIVGIGNGSQIAYEGFNPSFPIYANSGTGFSGPWSGPSDSSYTLTLNDRSLCYPQLQSSGGSVSAEGPHSLAERSLSQLLGANNTTVYLSFLLQPQALNSGFSFFGLFLGGNQGSLFIGKPGAGQVPSGTPTVVGQTVLLVVKAEFLPGNDRFTLYTNPKAGRSEPTNGVVKTDLNLGTVSVIGIISANGDFAVDEIRIGTTYADVVPVIDQTAPGHSGGCL